MITPSVPATGYPVPPPPPPPPPAVIYPSYPRVMYEPVETQHTFHLIMTICTLGAWFPVWMIVWVANSVRRKRTRIR